MTIYQVTYKQTLFLQQIRNVFYFETTVGNPDTGEWQDIVDEIRADYVAELTADMTDHWSFQGIDYRIVDTAGLPALSISPTAGSLAGASAVDGLATQMAMVVNVKGDTAKPRLGRTFLGGWTESEMGDSLFIASALDNAETFIDLQSGLNAGGTNPLQRVAVQWNVGHTAVTDENNIAGFAAVATAVPATIRSRRIGVGI